jgi:hypothetical protein
VAVVAAVACLGIAALSEPAVPDLKPGRPYVIEVEAGQTAIDLAFRGNTRYLLIVSSLAPADTEHTVALAAAPARTIASVPARVLHGLPAARMEAPPVAEIRRLPRTHSSRRVPPRAPAQRPASAPRERDFHLHVTEGSLDDPRHYARVRGRVVAEGEHVRVYLDGRLKPHGLAPGLVEEIVERFDHEIIPLASRWLGTYRDVDGDGRFAVLLTAWLGRLEGGRTSLGGFVRAADFRRDVAPPFGNACDMLYLNAELRPGPHLGALLAHEFAHAVCFSERAADNSIAAAFPDEDDWLNEAIAHVAENLHGASWTNLDYRISRYLADTARYPLVVPDYYHAGLWRNHGCRGATFLFLRWCVDQFGEGLLRRLVRGPLPGVRNLESATGLRFEDLFRRWTVALAASDPHAPGGYRSLDLFGMLPGWGLCGPRIESWNVAGNSRLLALKGMATTFVELHAREPGIRSITLRGTPGAALQVTLVPLPADAPRLELQAAWQLAMPAGRSSSTTAPRVLNLRVAGSSDNLEIDWAACEQHNGESRASVCFVADALVPHTDPAPPSRHDAPSRNRPLGTFSVVVPRSFSPDADVIVKVAGRDRFGRPAAAWTNVSLPMPENPPPTLASRTARRPDSPSRTAAPADPRRE